MNVGQICFGVVSHPSSIGVAIEEKVKYDDYVPIMSEKMKTYSYKVWGLDGRGSVKCMYIDPKLRCMAIRLPSFEKTDNTDTITDNGDS